MTAFGLLTALEIEDVPKIMRIVAQGYRGAQTRRFQNLWYDAADLLEEYADKMDERIKQEKEVNPSLRVKRVRL